MPNFAYAEEISTRGFIRDYLDDNGTPGHIIEYVESEKSQAGHGTYDTFEVSITKHNIVKKEKDFDTLKPIKSRPWIKHFQDKLYSLRGLPNNWNGYGSAAPNSIAIRYAQDILDILYENDFSPDEIFPSSEEGVALFLKKGRKHSVIECYNDGNILSIQYEDNGSPKLLDIGSSLNEIREALDSIFGFING